MTDSSAVPATTDRITELLESHAPDIRDGYHLGCLCGCAAPINYDRPHRAHVASLLAVLVADAQTDAQVQVLEEAADQLAETTNLSVVVMGLRKRATELLNPYRLDAGDEFQDSKD